MLANHLLMIAKHYQCCPNLTFAVDAKVRLSVGLNFLFMRTLGVAGIALSTNFVFLVWFLLQLSWKGYPKTIDDPARVRVTTWMTQ